MATDELSKEVGVVAACGSLCVPRATYYRSKRRRPVTPERKKSPRALSASEHSEVLDNLNSPRFVDMAPAAVFAVLLDEDKRYICSARTMYRILSEEGEVKERRNQLRHPKYSKPELLAVKPNQVWSWDITKLKGPVKWNYFYLYVIMDIFSRYVVGWMIATRESSALAKRLICETCEKQQIEENELTLHADRGSSMKSKPVAFLLTDLGITKTHSRPHTSNDNPYSEAQFKTLKHRPQFPARFGSIQDARVFCQAFFSWYNTEHRHSGIGYMTPFDVHYGKAQELYKSRQSVLLDAFASNPERFVNKIPVPPELPREVWINKPEKSIDMEDELAGLFNGITDDIRCGQKEEVLIP